MRPAIGLHATSKRAHDGPPNPDVDRPMANVLAELRVRMDPIAVAFRGIEGALIHYHQFEDWNSRTARQFAALHPRQRVALSMPRTPLGLAFFLDVTVEKVCCPMGTGLKREEVGRFFETTRAAGLVASKAGGNGNRLGDEVNTR